MAQLVKLKDYLSRYEKDPQYYSSEFPRLKKQFWQATCTRWVERDRSEIPIFEMDFEAEENFFSKIKTKLNPFQWKKKELEIIEEEAEELVLHIIPDEVLQGIRNEKDLKQVYLDELLKIQLRWVSADDSMYTSRLSRKYSYDERLKYFVQKFPDQYFYLHDPIFKIKKAPVELCSVLLAPSAVYCITYMERREESVLLGGHEKFWIEKYKDQETKILNPFFHLQRSANIVRTLIQEKDFPVYKVILCPQSYVNYDDLSSDTIIVDVRVYDEWMLKMRTFPTPVKFAQIRVLQNLLSYTAIRKGKKVEADSTDTEEETDSLMDKEGIKRVPPTGDEAAESLILNYKEVEELEALKHKLEEELLAEETAADMQLEKHKWSRRK